MKTTHDRLLTRLEAEKLLGVTVQQFANLREEGLVKGYSRPGFKRPGYWQSEMIALKSKLQPEPVAPAV